MVHAQDYQQLCLRAALLAGCAMLAAPAFAQTAAPAAPPQKDLQEVVVTAQRRSEKLQNVPIAITALSGAQLTRAGVQTTADLNGVIPGLNFTSSLGAYGLPTVRGVGSNSNGPGIENPVVTYIDGVYMVSPAGSLVALHDVSQVAVLKGPQGTLFGRNATGGLIQITTLDPGQAPRFDFDGSVGTRQYSSENLFASVPFSPTLAGSIAASNEDLLEGFGHNLYNGHSVQAHRSTAVRGKLVWRPDQDTRVTLSADYSYYRASDPALRTIGLNAIGQLTPGGPSDIDSNIQPMVNVKQWGTSLTAARDFAGFQVLGITAWRENRLDTLLDGDQTPISIPFTPASVQNKERDSQFSQELQFLSTTPGPFSWVAGAYYLHSTGQYDPVTVVLPFVGTSIQNVTQRLNSYSAFAQGTYKLLPDTNLTAGIRYTLDKRSISGTDLLDLGFFTVPGGPPDDASRSFSAPTARVSIDHRFSPDLLAYVSYNRGFKSGTFSPQNFPVVVVQPETLNAYEIGAKTDLLDHRLRFNVAGFYYDYANKQDQQIDNGVEYLYDAKSVQMYGMDSDITLRVTDALQITAGASAIHAEYTDFQDAPVTTASPMGGNLVGTGNVSGSMVEDTPTWTVNIGPSYRLDMPFGTFTASANYYHNSGWYAAPDNRVRQGAYNVLNADLQFVPASYSYLSIDLWGHNLTDAIYSAQLNETQTGDNRVAAPRQTLGLTVGMHF